MKEAMRCCAFLKNDWSVVAFSLFVPRQEDVSVADWEVLWAFFARKCPRSMTSESVNSTCHAKETFVKLNLPRAFDGIVSVSFLVLLGLPGNPTWRAWHGNHICLHQMMAERDSGMIEKVSGHFFPPLYHGVLPCFLCSLSLFVLGLYFFLKHCIITMNHPSRLALPRPPSLVRGDDGRRPTTHTTTTSTSSPTVASANGLVGNLSPTWRRDNTTLTAIINRALAGDGSSIGSLSYHDDGRVVATPSPPPPAAVDHYRRHEIPQSPPDSLLVTSERRRQLPPLPLWNDEGSRNSENEEEPCDESIIIPTPEEINGPNSSSKLPSHSRPSRLTGNDDHQHHHRKVFLVGLGTLFLLAIIGVSMGIVLPSGAGGKAADNDHAKQEGNKDVAATSPWAGTTCSVPSILKRRPFNRLDNVTVNENNPQQPDEASLARDWMERVATYLTPYFPHEQPCFPVSDTHIETLVWMTERMIVNQDNSSSLSHFDADAWLQVFVVSLLAQTWGVAGDPTAFSQNNNNNNNNDDKNGEETSPKNITATVAVGDDASLLNSFVAASPLHLCEWKGLGCNGQGQLMSLQWSKYYTPHLYASSIPSTLHGYLFLT